jgi:hypothetical protein
MELEPPRGKGLVIMTVGERSVDVAGDIPVRMAAVVGHGGSGGSGGSGGRGLGNLGPRGVRPLRRGARARERRLHREVGLEVLGSGGPSV